MKPEVKILDITDLDQREEYLEALRNGWGRFAVDTNKEAILVTMVKQPQQKIQTPKAK